MSNENIIQGRPPREESLELIEKGRELFWGSMDSLEQSARDLIKSVAFVKGVYLAIIVFAELPSQILESFALKIIFVLPVFLFLWSILFSTLSLLSRRYGIMKQSPSHINETIKKIIDYKANLLNFSFWFFVASLGVVFFNLTIFIFYSTS